MKERKKKKKKSITRALVSRDMYANIDAGSDPSRFPRADLLVATDYDRNLRAAQRTCGTVSYINHPRDKTLNEKSPKNEVIFYFIRKYI